MQILQFLTSYKTRLWLYGVVIATVPLLVTLGLITDTVSDKLLVLISAIFGISTGVTSMYETTRVPDGYVHVGDYVHKDTVAEYAAENNMEG